MGATEHQKRRKGGTALVAQILVFLLIATGLGGFLSFKRYVEESPRFCHTCHDIAPEVALWMESDHREVRCQACHHSELEDGLRVLKIMVAGGQLDAPHSPVDLSSCGRCHASHDDRWPSIANSTGHALHMRQPDIDCVSCHGSQMHFNATLADTCAECHRAESRLRHGASKDESQEVASGNGHCLACHNFLSSESKIRPQRRDCMTCHRSQARPVVVGSEAPMFFPCSACHRPHRSEAPVVPCIDCHRDSELKELHEVDGHGPCSACHEPHDWVSTQEHCFKCHGEARSHHPEQPCRNCHRFEVTMSTAP